MCNIFLFQFNSTFYRYINLPDLLFDKIVFIMNKAEMHVLYVKQSTTDMIWFSPSLFR